MSSPPRAPHNSIVSPGRPPIGLAKILQAPEALDTSRRPRAHTDGDRKKTTRSMHEGPAIADSVVHHHTSLPRRSQSPLDSRIRRHTSGQRYSPYPLSSDSGEGSRTMSPDLLSSPPQMSSDLRPSASSSSHVSIRPSPAGKYTAMIHPCARCSQR
jgi:hypothetical protein